MPSTSASSPTDKILSRIRAGLSLGLMDAENFQTLMDSNSGDVDELKRVALSLARAIDLVEDQSKALDVNDPSLIIPREIVSALASQASTGDAIIAEWLDSRKAAAVQAIETGIAQAKSLNKMSLKLRELLNAEDSNLID